MGLKKADGAVTGTDEEAANKLDNCFQHMFTKDDGVDHGNHDSKTPKISVWHNSAPNFSIPDVTAKLQRLNSNRSAVPDGIHPMLLRSCATAVVETLSMIFTSSFQSGEIPEDWKTAPSSQCTRNKKLS